ncbi:transformer-2 protein [Mitosporidium daphniae]|uniref:Transformer-2 protein n=1 Tax=Mitosporidium daphniae TaxID=1485682 RepID=A0A098VQF4_9MICR|nr:transformer-2 protein [Mitosporidium daphniae]KGG51210.1 transformer-2 protein [Mitosporidium daphniae]|eukprot:XP_013237637.1 transformer-2 protein [Mitosporidium daphniae]
MAESRKNESTSTGPISNVLGIFGLSMYTTEKTLQEIYEPYGNVESVKLIYDRDSRRSRGFGFVTFELDGRPIRVDYSRTRGPHDPTPGRYMGKPTRYHSASPLSSSRQPRPPHRGSYYGGDDRRHSRSPYYDDRAMSSYSRRDDRGPYYNSGSRGAVDDRYYSRPSSSYRSEYPRDYSREYPRDYSREYSKDYRDHYSRDARRDATYHPRRGAFHQDQDRPGDANSRQGAYDDYPRQSRLPRTDRSLSPC